MDITQQLIDLAEKLRDKHGHLSEDSVLCQQAAQLISTQRDQLERYPKENLKRYFCAALTGLLAATPYNIQGSFVNDDRLKIIGEAEALAKIASGRSLVGEDS